MLWDRYLLVVSKPIFDEVIIACVYLWANFIAFYEPNGILDM